MTERRIRLVVTGDLERKALVRSLRQHFPQEDLHGTPVTWLPPRKTNGVTTHRLRANASPSNPMCTLARAVLAEALDGADGKPADLVVAIDDLELHNVDQPAVVCQHFVAATHQELERRLRGLLSGEQDAARARVRERCSFHLLSPMIESTFFGEKAALVRAGCAPTVSPALRTTDWEDFWCTDPSFLLRSTEVNAAKAAAPLANSWWREERHAKHYLEHLVSDHDGFYEETVGGARALEPLTWPTVPRQPTECPLIRALFDDLANFFGIFSPLPSGTPSPHTCASGIPGPRSTRLLRNLP